DDKDDDKDDAEDMRSVLCVCVSVCLCVCLSVCLLVCQCVGVFVTKRNAFTQAVHLFGQCEYKPLDTKPFSLPPLSRDTNTLVVFLCLFKDINTLGVFLCLFKDTNTLVVFTLSSKIQFFSKNSGSNAPNENGIECRIDKRKVPAMTMSGLHFVDMSSSE